eukprot:6194204-Pleurochrysis_carterae.AAC.2
MRDYGVDARQQIWDYTWKEFLKYAKQGDRGRTAVENAGTNAERTEACSREPYPTQHPGEVGGGAEASKEIRHQRRNMRGLTDRARTNQHKQGIRDDTHKGKRIRLANREIGARIVSDKPKQKIGGGEWKTLPRVEDTTARRLLGGQDGGGTYEVFKDETMDLAHEEEYAGHPILNLFTRPEEMENGLYRSMSREDVRSMNGVGGKKLTYETLQVAMS